jgi:mannose-1-phosphate guanylyltransferase
MVADGSLYAMADGGAYWLDAGTPETYIQAHLDVVEGRRAMTPPTTCIAPTASVAASALVEQSVVAAGARIEADAEIVGSIVQRGSTVGAKARVINSIIGERATVGEGATVEDVTVIGPGEVVAPGTAFQRARVPEEGT